MITCDYAAFPTRDSCLEGCGWEAGQGADIAGELACVQDAGCDTFSVVECEHAFGAGG